MVDEQVTGMSGVPSTYAYLLHRSPLAASRDKLVSLRYCSQAGGHMSRQIKQELRRVLPAHTLIYIMYGATEASARLSYLDPADFDRKMDSIGKAIQGVTLRVIGENGAEVPIGQTGGRRAHTKQLRSKRCARLLRGETPQIQAPRQNRFCPGFAQETDRQD
jgi:acyl-CoA synthetase (AMP-forming)/AMP-acid ligase II